MKIFLAIVLVLFAACDCSRKKKCEWVMVPDEKNDKFTEEGYAMVCLRNYELNRQKCFITIKLSLAERIYSRKFKYSELKLDEDKSPNEILDIKPCDPSE